MIIWFLLHAISLTATVPLRQKCANYCVNLAAKVPVNIVFRSEYR